MQMTKVDKQYLVTMFLCFFTSIMCYWGLEKMKNLLSYMIFGITKLSEISVAYTLYSLVIIDVLVILLLIFLIIKVIRIRSFESPNSPSLFLTKRRLKILGLSVLIIYVVNFITNLCFYEFYDNSIQEYYITLEEKLYITSMYELAQSIIDFIQVGLVITLFFILVNKIYDKGQIKADN